jgi:hypothetical protein
VRIHLNAAGTAYCWRFVLRTANNNPKAIFPNSLVLLAFTTYELSIECHPYGIHCPVSRLFFYRYVIPMGLEMATFNFTLIYIRSSFKEEASKRMTYS